MIKIILKDMKKLNSVKVVMRPVLVLFVMLLSVTLMACHNHASQGYTKTEEDAETRAEEIVGKWEHHSAEGFHILHIASDGSGRLVSYDHASSATEKFTYTVTDEGVVVDWDKLTKETYYAVLTVDGKYLVLDNGSSVMVYKKKGK